MNHRRGIFFFFLLVTATVTFGQAKPVAEVSVEKNPVLLGEPFRFRVQVHFPEGASGSFPVIDSIPHFEFTQPPVIDSSHEKGARNIKGIYYLRSFDSGHWVIPAFPVSAAVKTDTIGVDVIFSSFDPEQPYHDIKDIIEVKAESAAPWWWYAAGGALLLAILLWYIFRKKKTAPAGRPVHQADPYTEAIGQLDELQRSKPAPKQFHSRLTEILRLYLYRKKGILSLQKTTDDLVLQLRDAGLAADHFERLTQALRLSDFVKFAKYIPSPADDENCLGEIRETITNIERAVSSKPEPGRK